MALTVDAAERQLREYMCPCCKAPIERTWNHVYRDDEPWAVYYATSYHHKDQPHDTWIDAVMGTWGDMNFDDHVTFGCRVGPGEGGPTPGATLVDALQGFPQSPIHGQVLTREQGLAHPWLPHFWEVVDFVLVHDPTVHRHLYGQ